MDEPKAKKKLTIQIVVGILIVVLASGAFYWIWIRPARARENCHREALTVSQNEDIYNHPNGTYDVAHYNFAYDACMHNKGL